MFIAFLVQEIVIELFVCFDIFVGRMVLKDGFAAGTQMFFHFGIDLFAANDNAIIDDNAKLSILLLTIFKSSLEITFI